METGYYADISVDRQSNSAVAGFFTNHKVGSFSTEQYEDQSRLTQLVSNNLRGQLKNMKINLAQNLAERKQVYRMLGNTATRLRLAYGAFKRGNLPEIVKTLSLKDGQPWTRNLASNWLEYQYGWKPLLGDVYQATLKYFGNPRPKVFWVSSSDGRARYTELNLDYTGYTYKNTDIASTRVRGVVFYEVTSSNLATLSEYGVFDPLLLAWELLPYSFVADWFTNVGGYLQGLNLSGLTFHKGYWNVHKKREYSTSTSAKFAFSVPRPPPYEFPPGTPGYNGAITTKLHQFERIKMSSFPSGYLILKENPLTEVRVANALSLLRVAFSDSAPDLRRKT